MDFIAYVVFNLARYDWFLIPLSVFIGVVWLRWFPPRLRLHRAFLRVIAVVGLIFPFLATGLPAHVIAKLGRIGSAQITGLIDGAQQRQADELGRSQLGGHWNDFRVKLTGGDGIIYEIRLYPENRFPLTPTTFTLFLVGDRFNVRYLRMSPQHFVVIKDDNSPWAIRERCYQLAKEIELIRADPHEYDAPAAREQNDRQRYKDDNCKTVVAPDWRSPSSAQLKELGN